MTDEKALREKLDRMEFVLGQLITWLRVELGQHNADQLLAKLHPVQVNQPQDAAKEE